MSRHAQSPNRILAVGLMGNGFLPSESVVRDLQHDLATSSVHPQAQIKTHRGKWASKKEMSTAAVTFAMLGLIRVPAVSGSFGSHTEMMKCITLREWQTAEGACCVVTVWEREPRVGTSSIQWNL